MDRELPMYIQLADSTIKRYSDLSDKWDHEYGVVLKGMEDVWRLTGDTKYYEFILKSIEPNISEEGNINGYDMEAYELDNINTGRLLFSLYDETKKEKYKKAAYVLKSQLENHPRTSFGNFLHKKQFKDIIFIDSVYMGLVFCGQFGKVFNDLDALNDAVNQIINAAKFNQNKENGLLVQGYNETKTEMWANSETGLSQSYWGRGLGWYSVGLVEILEYLPVNHPKRGELLEIFQKLMEGVVKVQDESGVWWQVVDQGDKAGNYLEASASSMFTYALAKGVRLGYLDDNYKAAALKAYNGLVKEFIEVDASGEAHLNHTCKSGGLGVKDYRNGSFESYACEATGIDDHKGVGTFLMAGVQIELLNK
ncbi:unsaturated rhamnogalacturonyl hydrolase [Natronincola peptidivorans]|uniref:Unsaturated rhamnogalacturonyl hydrolase n=1 Tax=Natronincola peptidivorans TaxID=426128 RepID=A0A1I0G825_9FIRM|nr:glycoside hydrolase family 88 protein [Natronincola peptidivorans]SET66220.1 unsaturated rhamnogalacturonyl hydrolase [Natronincola peptidivorans]